MNPIQVKTPAGAAYVDFDEVIALGPEEPWGPVRPAKTSVRTMYLRGGSELTVLDDPATMKQFLQRRRGAGGAAPKTKAL